MVVDVLLLAVGLALLIASSDYLISECETIAARLNISPVIVGLTLVAFGTSFPELVVSLRAAAVGSDGLALGNVVGSNIANTLLIMGVAALFMPIGVSRTLLKRDGLVWLIATGVFIIFVFGGTVHRYQGILMLLMLAGYLFVLLKSGDIAPDEADAVNDQKPLWVLGFIVTACFGGIAFGAHLTVGSAIDIARALNVSESVIGVTIIAFGTSLPELATTLACVRKRNTGMLIGNIIGSNIFNILAVVGLTAALLPLNVPAHMLTLDIPALIMVTLVGMIFLRTDWEVSRKEAAICLMGYAGYMTWVFLPVL